MQFIHHFYVVKTRNSPSLLFSCIIRRSDC